MTTTGRSAALALLLVLVLVPAVALRADEPAGITVQLPAEVEINAIGDAAARIRLVFPADTYRTVKAKNPEPRKFLQDLLPDRSDFELGDANAAYDDEGKAVVLTLVELGAAKNRGGGQWEMTMERGYDYVKSSPADAPRVVATFAQKGEWANGVRFEGTYTYALPPGARQAHWDGDRRVLSWRLEPAPATGEPRLDVDLRARDRLMSTIYKVYGLGSDLAAFWVSKTVVRNLGYGPARNLRMRYRLQGYGEWSPWEKYPEVAVGQTVVSVHYPVLDAGIAKLRSNTPANLLLEYTYEDASGKRHEEDEAKRLVILGVNEFVFGNLSAGESFGTWQEEFNNAPLLAAWVTRNDGAVKQFAAMANKNAGGVGANTDVKSAVAVLKACYELLQLNDFSYQHPPGLSDKTVSFDVKDVQNVKFPRDTIRDRSGTCIDLAILYAAMVNAVGLEPHLALIPGHCFPVVKLPDGHLVGVETTGVSGGIRFGSAPFEKVLEYGTQELQKAAEDGRIYLVDVRSNWTRGIANPELEDLPADILQRWGISETGRGATAPAAGPAAGPGPEAPATGAGAAVGLWGGSIEAKVQGGTIHVLIVGIDHLSGDTYRAGMRAELTVDTSNGPVPVVLVAQYEGTAQGDAIGFKSVKKVRKIGDAEEQEVEGDLLAVKVEGGKLVGKVGTEQSGFTDFSLAPKKD